jgi:hypothetical protein
MADHYPCAVREQRFGGSREEALCTDAGVAPRRPANADDSALPPLGIGWNTCIDVS